MTSRASQRPLSTLAFAAALPTYNRAPRIQQLATSCQRYTTNGAIILGGSSGVGLEAAQYLRTQAEQVSTFSRSTGHDFRKIRSVEAALSSQDSKIAVCVGAGRREFSIQEEALLYRNIAMAIEQAGPKSLVVLVVRSLAVASVRNLFSDISNTPWVILRPGALVDRKDSISDISQTSGQEEKLLVTPDIRCNGLVSRKGVGRVVGDMLLDAVKIEDIHGKVIGVYDKDKMINNPKGAVLIGEGVWG